jgi:GxxExxY protein
MFAETCRDPRTLPLLLEDLTRKVIGGFYYVHSSLGDGLLENAYVGALFVHLTRIGLAVRREVPVDVFFDGVPVGHYRIDLLVNDQLIVEVKAGPSLSEHDERQLRNYLRCSKLEVGLLFLFGPKPKFRRFVYSNARKSHMLDNDPRRFPPIQ